jgi:leucyl/phenylalanyl-tRNA---protein transferase
LQTGAEELREGLTVEELLYAYQVGYFPMADSYDGEIYWHSPDPRAIFPIDKIKVPRSVRQSISRMNFSFRIDTSFENVMRACSLREETWINEEMIDIYTRVHKMGFAHSVETWVDDALVGGLYGITINGAFFGESMFNSMPDASKAAFYILVERLRERGFVLLDSQYINDFTKQLGAVEIPKTVYLSILNYSLGKECIF